MRSELKYSYTYNDQTYSFELDYNQDGTYNITIGDHTYQVAVQNQLEDDMILIIDNVRIPVHSVSQGDERYLYVEGQHYDLVADDERSSRRRATTGNAGNLTAQMPGQVTTVAVTVGEQVKSGQTLVILEAMKMEIRITAPAAGMIKQVLVTQGDVVERGQVLVELSGDDVS